MKHFNAIEFRRHLHAYPELSGQEQNTAAAITKQLIEFGFSPKTNIGGLGILVEIAAENTDVSTLLRADFDALPIQELGQGEHISQKLGCMHACGHDGHTASLLETAYQLSLHPPKSGTIYLLFQPAEEIGTGARSMLDDPQLEDLNPDAVFAYHNLPGYPLGQVIIKDNVFACASVGVKIALQGKTSHAARPEDGVSPAPVVCKLMDYLNTMSQQYADVFSLVTLVHVNIGNEGFGTSPGDAQVMATLRSDNEAVLAQMKTDLVQYAKIQAKQQDLKVAFEWVEPFNATINNAVTTQEVCIAAEQLQYPLVQIAEPMRWSEDMAEFLHQWSGTLFCLGSGEHHPQLHNPDYDFPDQLIDIASRLFLQILHNRHGLYQSV